MTTTISVLLADDHQLVRDGIRHALAKDDELRVVGEAENGDQVRTLCREQQPDVLLLDLQMPGSRPTETIAYVRAHCPSTRIVILTAHNDAARVSNATSAGVDGYILKDEATQIVVEAVQTVAEGQVWFSSEISGQMAQLVSQTRRVQDALTPREIEVLQLMAHGDNNEAIATSLQISERTVKFHVGNIYQKLGVSCRSEAVVWAWEQGLVTRGR